MKTIVITEGLDHAGSLNVCQYDLTTMKLQNCIGCWSCWWKTPGRCAFKELDAFYRDYISADRVVFLCRPVNQFVSARLKTLFDRMIPLFLPYISVATGECMHVKRYEKYPDIDFYYEDCFETQQDREIFVRYIHRVFYQFHSGCISVKPLEQFSLQQEVTAS